MRLGSGLGLGSRLGLGLGLGLPAAPPSVSGATSSVNGSTCVAAEARRGRSRRGSTAPPRTKAGTRSVCTGTVTTRAPG